MGNRAYPEIPKGGPVGKGGPVVKRLLLAASALALAFAHSSAFAQAAAKPEPADLVLHNGRIMTEEGTGPQAQALAVRDARIVEIGTNAQVNKLIGPKTKVIDLTGKL